MFVIAAYDINTETKSGRARLPKLMKLMRQYLHHTQKSVFEGELTEAKFFELQKNVEKIIDNETDYVIFYKMDNKNNVKRLMYGIQFDPNEVVL